MRVLHKYHAIKKASVEAFFCLSGKAGKPSSLKDDCVTPTEGKAI
jgi:hypothetical protein